MGKRGRMEWWTNGIPEKEHRTSNAQRPVPNDKMLAYPARAYVDRQGHRSLKGKRWPRNSSNRTNLELGRCRNGHGPTASPLPSARQAVPAGVRSYSYPPESCSSDNKIFRRGAEAQRRGRKILCQFTPPVLYFLCASAPLREKPIWLRPARFCPVDQPGILLATGPQAIPQTGLTQLGHRAIPMEATVGHAGATCPGGLDDVTGQSSHPGTKSNDETRPWGTTLCGEDWLVAGGCTWRKRWHCLDGKPGIRGRCRACRTK